MIKAVAKNIYIAFLMSFAVHKFVNRFKGDVKPRHEIDVIDDRYDRYTGSPLGLFQNLLQIYTVEVRQLTVLESPLEQLTC